MPSVGLQQSDYRVRKLIGGLGLSLPILLPLSEMELLSSMSHYYYYSLSSILLIFVLSSFGLFLISYKGYQKDSSNEKISDDFLTNIGGFAILIVVLIPTQCANSESVTIDALCASENYPLLGHMNKTLNIIHLISAGIFIFTMGWMSKYKFTRGQNQANNKIYRLCGNIVWGAIALLIVLVIIDFFQENFQITKYDVFILETVALVPFGISWLIKGEAMEDIKGLFSKTKTLHE
jgi:UDP-N-acetylmuramyl pentapeptide phosphotransferase/UDP-N-acetylglucosamine-1-phosphate transferase